MLTPVTGEKEYYCMKIDFKCYDCIFKLILELSEQLGSDGETRKRLANGMLEKFVEVSARGGSPPELLAHLWGEIRFEASGCADPMKEIKRNSTELGLRLLPRLREAVRDSADPFAADV